MAYLSISGSEVFAGSFDTLIMLIGEEKEVIYAFSGFLGSLHDELKKFEPNEVLIYQGRKAKDIFAAERKRNDMEQEIRRVEITHQIKCLIVDWLFSSDHFMVIE